MGGSEEAAALREFEAAAPEVLCWACADRESQDTVRQGTERGTESTITRLPQRWRKRSFDWENITDNQNEDFKVMAAGYCRTHAPGGVEGVGYVKPTLLPRSVLSTCTVTQLTDKKVMRSEEITPPRYQNKGRRLILKHVYAYKSKWCQPSAG